MEILPSRSHLIVYFFANTLVVINLQMRFATEFPLFDHVTQENDRKRHIKRDQRKSGFSRTHRSRSYEVQSFNSHYLYAVFCLSNAQFKHSTDNQFKRHKRVYDHFDGKVNTINTNLFARN